MSQPRTFQKEIIKEMRDAGEIDQLVWFIEMEVPYSQRLHKNHKKQPANYPPGFIPVVPAANGGEHYAHLLLEVIKTHNPGKIFRTAIADIPTLTKTGLSWYVWGTDLAELPDVDTICTLCGLVGKGRPGTALGCSQGCMKPI